MGIRKLFDSTWDDIYPGALAYGDSDILPEQKTIIINRNIKKLILSQLIMIFDEDGRMVLATTRYCLVPFAIPAYLHTLEQNKRLLKAGIITNVAFEKGVVTCTYSRAGWLERLLLDSCVPKYQQPTLTISEESMD